MIAYLPWGVAAAALGAITVGHWLAIRRPLGVSGVLARFAALAEEQRSQKMRFTLDKERQEAQRKQIEAEGIAKYQNIVRQGLTAEYLQFKGIEATERLASSPNAKVVVVGGGKGGLPLILGEK